MNCHDCRCELTEQEIREGVRVQRCLRCRERITLYPQGSTVNTVVISGGANFGRRRATGRRVWPTKGHEG